MTNVQRHGAVERCAESELEPDESRLRPLPLKSRRSSVRVGACGAVATVSIVEPVTPARLAVTTEVPCARPVAAPVLEMLATEGVADAQVTCPVRSRAERSEKTPVAVNCCVAPTARLGSTGVTAIDWRAAGAPTVIVPAMPPAVPFPLSKPWTEQK